MDKAMIACKTSGRNVSDDFAEVSKIVEAGATSKPVKDYELSRYACYMIVQNGDPRKEVIALGQTYFAIQTYRLLFAAILSNGTSCLRRRRMTRVLLQMKNLQYFKTPGIWGCTAA